MHLRISYLIRGPCLLNLFNYTAELIVRSGYNYVKVVIERLSSPTVLGNSASVPWVWDPQAHYILSLNIS